MMVHVSVPASSVQHFVGYDPDGYSMWFCDYKYTDENTVNFVVMNKVRVCATLSDIDQHRTNSPHQRLTMPPASSWCVFMCILSLHNLV